MNILSHPTERTFWIIFKSNTFLLVFNSEEALVAGYTDPAEVTETKWEIRIYNTQQEWEDACVLYGLEIPPLI